MGRPVGYGTVLYSSPQVLESFIQKQPVVPHRMDDFFSLLVSLLATFKKGLSDWVPSSIGSLSNVSKSAAVVKKRRAATTVEVRIDDGKSNNNVDY